VEDDDVVQAVEELRLEEALDLVEDQRPGLRVARGGELDETDGALVRGQGLGARLEVPIRMVLRKETARPWASARRPSSRICSSMLKTSGWAFSILYRRITV